MVPLFAIARACLTSVFIGAFAVACMSQNVLDNKRATVVSYWKKGDVRTYKLTRTKTGKRNEATSVMIHLKVISATDSGYVVECVYRDARLLSARPEEPQVAMLVDQLIQASEGLRVVVNTSETGMLGEVTNAAEVKRHSDRIFQAVAKFILDENDRKVLIEALSKLISVESLMEIAEEDLGYLLYPFGIEYALNEATQVDIELPSPIGGTPLPAKLSITMTKLDVQNETAIIEMNQRIDPAGLSSWVVRLVDQLGKSMSASERGQMEQAMLSMEINDQARFEVDLNGAWLTKATHVRVVTIEGQVKRDERVYELQK